MPGQDTDNSVQVSFIPSFHRIKPVLANYPSLSFNNSFWTLGQSILANIPVYKLGLLAVQTHYEVVVKADVLICGQPKSAIIPLPIACMSIQKRIRILYKSG